MTIISSAPTPGSTPVKPVRRGNEPALRPETLASFIGQPKIIKNIRVYLSAAQKRHEPLEHLLFYGPPGLGKTTLAHVIARELKVNLRITSGPAIERTGDLASILTNLNTGDILFIDEIHRLSKVVEEALYPAMEDYCFDIIVGKGPGARTLRLELKRFTIVGATTRIGLMSAPLRDRFGIIERLEYYRHEELTDIIRRTASLLPIKIEPDAIEAIARRARGTPRIANRILKRIRDFAQDEKTTVITQPIAVRALDALGIDQYGLDTVDQKLLKNMALRHKGGPVGLETLAALISEDAQTIEEVIEPYLMQCAFLKRTPRGRMLTEKGFSYLGVKPPSDQPKLI